MTEGSIIDYDVMKITGKYHPENMLLDVITRVDAPENSKQSVKCLRVPMEGPSMYLCSYLTGEPEPTLDTLKDTLPFPYLINGKWEPADGSVGWLGEANVVRPYQALLTINPVVGEVITQDANVMWFNDDGQVIPGVFKYKYSTLAVGPWGNNTWPDTIRTGMIENYDDPTKLAAYNYVWAKGIGPVNYWQGAVNPTDNTIEGYEYYAIGWRGQ